METSETAYVIVNNRDKFLGEYDWTYGLAKAKVFTLADARVTKNTINNRASKESTFRAKIYKVVLSTEVE